MKLGDLAKFPCDSENYEKRVGIFLGFHDNKADIWDRSGVTTPIIPRKVASILYKGKIFTCWGHHVEELLENKK